MAREGLARLTVEIPEELHRRAKVRAAEQGTELRALVIAGLESVLASGQSKRGGNDARSRKK